MNIYRRCGTCRQQVNTDTCCGTVTWGYRVRVNTPEGTKRVRRSGFARKKDAEQACAAEVTDRSRREFIEDSDLSVREFARDTFLPLIESQVKAGTLAPNTASDYRRNIEARAFPVLGHLRVQDVKPSDLQKLYGQLTEEYATKTISNTARTLHRFFEVAIDDGIIRANPCKRAKAPKVEQEPQATLTPAELDAVLGWVRDNEAEHLALFLTYVTTGVRRGEALGLRWSDVDLDAGTAEVVQQVTTEDGKVVVKAHTKSRKRRTIPLLPVVVVALREHHARQREVSPAAWNRDGLVFAREDGSPMRPRHVNRLVDRAITGAKVTRVTPHGLRHSAASILLDNGASVPAVASLLGHANATITMNVYAHLVGDADRQAVQSLGDAIFGQAQ